MMAYAPPSTNPADLKDLTGHARTAFRKQMLMIDGMIPVKVISISDDRRFVQVQPQIRGLTTTGETFSRGQIAKIPNWFMGCGGFILAFPTKPGDEGYAFAADRDISLYLRDGSETPPNTNRIKSFSDSVFIPAKLFGDITFDPADADSFVIQSLDGTVKVAMSTTQIILKAPDGVVIEGPLIVNDEIVANGGMTVTGGGDNSINLNGNLFVTGNIQATGSITPDVPPPPDVQRRWRKRTVKSQSFSLRKLLGGK